MDGHRQLACCIILQAVKDVRTDGEFASDARQFLASPECKRLLKQLEIRPDWSSLYQYLKGEQRMDPISQILHRYSQYLREGGRPVSLAEGGFNVASTRDKRRLLHPSGLGPGLCDRLAVYNVMEDIGAIKPDIPIAPELELQFHAGYTVQDEVARALAWGRVLRATEVKVEDRQWTGRIDLIVDPTALGIEFPKPVRHLKEGLWIVDVKAVMGALSYQGHSKYPKTQYIGQLWMYEKLLQQHPDYKDTQLHPILYVISRNTFEAVLYWWRWGKDGTCLAYPWPTKAIGNRRYPYLLSEIEECRLAQEAWLAHETMPPRCYETPEKHPFLCVNKDTSARTCTPKCKWFCRCWEVEEPRPFHFNSWPIDENEEIPF